MDIFTEYKKNNKNLLRILLILMVVVITCIDQFFKLYFNSHPEIIYNFWFLEFSLLKNYGGLFGIPLLGGMTLQLLLFVFIFLTWIWATFNKSLFLLSLCMTLILAGGMSNLIDRLKWGYVIDYIDTGFWPVFNIADACISLGVVILIGLVLLDGKNINR